MITDAHQQILQIWTSLAQHTWVSEEASAPGWRWSGRGGSNSVSDAEQLLCLLYPAGQLSGFLLDLPDQVADDVLESLQLLGDSVTIPLRLIRVFADHLGRYVGTDGRASFAGGSGFLSASGTAEPTAEQRELDVVVSMELAVSLTLQILGFVRVFRSSVYRPEIRQAVDEVEQMASKRLSAAMVGLVRSFCVQTYRPDSDRGRALLRTINQTGAPIRAVLDQFQQATRTVRAGLREVTIGSRPGPSLEHEDLLFECGWTWGIVAGAPPVELPYQPYLFGSQPEGYAAAEPLPYFTMRALAGTSDLLSERTRILGLLNEDQQRLASALQLRCDLAVRYCSTVAMFGPGRWPLEDTPWRTQRGDCEYDTLAVATILRQRLRGSPDDNQADRLIRVLEELAIRARVNRRPIAGEPAIALHVPGITVPMPGTGRLGPELAWPASNFAATLLQTTVGLAPAVRGPRLRDRLDRLSTEIWDHVLRRRHTSGAAEGLWDAPEHAFPDLPPGSEQPSWTVTEQVVEALVSAIEAAQHPVRAGVTIDDLASEIIDDAEQALDRELQNFSSESGQPINTRLHSIQIRIEHARTIAGDRASASIALALDALKELEQLAQARRTGSADL